MPAELENLFIAFGAASAVLLITWLIRRLGPTDEEVKERWKDDFIYHLSSIHPLEMNFAYIVGVAEKNYTEHFHYGLCPREAAQEELARFKLKRGIK